MKAFKVTISFKLENSGHRRHENLGVLAKDLDHAISLVKFNRRLKRDLRIWSVNHVCNIDLFDSGWIDK